MRSLATLLLVVPAAGGCLGPGAMRPIAPDRGTEVRYAVSVDTLLSALPAALADRRLRIAFREPFDSATTMFIAVRGGNLFSYGELVRVLVSPTADGSTSARFVARSRNMLDLSGRVDRVVPRLIQALDDTIGPAALGPFPEMRVRGRAGDGAGIRVRGTMTAGPDGGLSLAPHPGLTDPSVPLATLRDPAVYRGSYSHRLEGSNIGALIGMVAGPVIGATASNGFSRGGDIAYGIMIGGLAGTVVGSGIGAAFRTEVWSPLAPPERPD